jgi:hypothetical protein
MKSALIGILVACASAVCHAAEPKVSALERYGRIGHLLQEMVAGQPIPALLTGMIHEHHLQKIVHGEPLPEDIVYVRVSDQALKRILSGPLARRVAVRDNIVGTPVRGIATTVGQTDVRLVPATGRAVIDLLVTGEVQAQTTGFGGPVRVHSASNTRFSAIKRLILDERGIRLLPARVSARTAIAIENVSTDLPRLRGRIVRRVGSRRAAESRPAAEAESARKAEMRIAADLDRQVANDLRNAQSRLSRFLAELPRRNDALRGRAHFATSNRHLQVTIYRDEGKRVPRAPPSLVALGSPDVAIHVHSSLLQRIARNTIFGAEVEPWVSSLFNDEKPQYVSLVAGEPKAESNTRLRQSIDRRWWSLAIGNIALVMPAATRR